MHCQLTLYQVPCCRHAIVRLVCALARVEVPVAAIGESSIKSGGSSLKLFFRFKSKKDKEGFSNRYDISAN